MKYTHRKDGEGFESPVRFDWGNAYYAGIRLGFDEGYAALRADKMEKRWKLRQTKQYKPNSCAA